MRRRRSPGRWLAPIALIAVALAAWSVVNTTLLKDDSPGATATQQSPTTSKSKDGDGSTKRASKRRRRSYRVKPGDTLSAIAVKTGVPLERIQRLNPNIDSQSLQTGQRVKLSP